MIKKTAVLFLVCSFYAVAFSMHTPAANQQAADVLNEYDVMNINPGSKVTDPLGDPALISAKTGPMIDALWQALKDEDPESLRPALEESLKALDVIQEQQLVEECKNALLSGLFYSGQSLLQTLSGGGDPVCLSLSAGSTIADILLVLQSYQLCVIDNSEIPDEALRETVCQQQQLVKTYQFVAGLLYATRCTYGTTFATYLILIINFLNTFTACS